MPLQSSFTQRKKFKIANQLISKKTIHMGRINGQKVTEQAASFVYRSSVGSA